MRDEAPLRVARGIPFVLFNPVRKQLPAVVGENITDYDGHRRVRAGRGLYAAGAGVGRSLQAIDYRSNSRLHRRAQTHDARFKSRYKRQAFPFRGFSCAGGECIDLRMLYQTAARYYRVVGLGDDRSVSMEENASNRRFTFAQSTLCLLKCQQHPIRKVCRIDRGSGVDRHLFSVWFGLDVRRNCIPFFPD